MKHGRWLGLLAIAVAFALTYGPGLPHFFTADDFVLLHYMRDNTGVDIVRERLLHGPRSDVASPWWRPAWLLLFNASYEAFGLSPAALRGVVWLLHGAMLVLVFAVASRVVASSALALCAAALFALAPSYAEALLWISAGLNVLPAAICLFVAAVAYAHFVESGARRAWLVAWLTFVLSFLFREAGYHMPLVVVAAHLTLSRGSPVGRRLLRGVLHSLPFCVVVVLHNLFLNPFDVSGMSLAENLRTAGRHGALWLQALFAVPDGPWSAVATLAVGTGAMAAVNHRARFCLLWALAASFPFVARTHETRFLYFAHAPLALAVVLACGPWAHGLRTLAVLVPALVLVVGLNATRIGGAVRAHAASAQVSATFIELLRGEQFAGDAELHVDFLPPELADGAPEALELYLGHKVRVVNQTLLERAPFVIFGQPAFEHLADDTTIVHFDHAARRFTRTTRGALIAGRPLVPMFAFRHQARQVTAWPEMQFARDVVHLLQPPPPLDLVGDGVGKVVWVRAGNVSRFDLGVETPRDGYLVIAFIVDLTTVGGHAFVDGAATPLLVVDGLFNAVPVRKGTHEVVVKTSL